ncbi:energy-coupling factor ABC transporter ATP-binding protein [Diaphorobacter sp.]|uniref:energy-coupling factor ABC transporter ATP-binding protein n=1 Tax=Diaphorobacter sp. TaxID=1934310 RepID=UPI003D130EC2
MPSTVTHPAADLPDPAAPLLELRQVRLRRGATQVFDGLSLALAEPRIGLIGHNGAGKTSLLRLLCALDVPASGQVLSQGHNLHALPQGQLRALRVGMMFQNPDDQIIFPTVQEELALGLQPQGLPRRDAQARARNFLAGRGLAGWAERAVATLSQGQRQQVCWLALLLAGPRTLLLDEPYASLDLPGQARLADDIAACDRQVLVSTHVLDHVRDYPRVIWLHEGRVQADGPGRAVCAAYEAAVARQVAQARAGAAERNGGVGCDGCGQADPGLAA